jgi:hypothetical protein
VALVEGLYERLHREAATESLGPAPVPSRPQEPGVRARRRRR